MGIGGRPQVGFQFADGSWVEGLVLGDPGGQLRRSLAGIAESGRDDSLGEIVLRLDAGSLGRRVPFGP